jgi:hypothetical protein
LTSKFTFSREEGEKKSDELTTSTITPEDIEEEAEEKADDKEDEKSPFGFVFGPKQQLQTFKEGGLIIQRLRVRHGGIAIAGTSVLIIFFCNFILIKLACLRSRRCCNGRKRRYSDCRTKRHRFDTSKVEKCKNAKIAKIVICILIE